ncbi:MAG: HD domain-containing protein [Candidatus Bathyarchaeota archaeon]|nr:HD domain-containing protein [Candidatus Termiticorpusculum sp.]
MKIIRDPVYDEYIEIDENIFENVVDTAAFQRLRRIRQTSFSSLYHTSTHDRFSHSLGVYHLGKIATEAIFTSLDNNKLFQQLFPNGGLGDIKRTVQLACLFHDIGHAPFSHTGENFYLSINTNVQKPDPLDVLLVQEVRKSSIDEELTVQNEKKKISSKAAPHEIMSALLALKKFPAVIDKNQEFFARCITGYPYEVTPSDTGKQLLNALISVVNSSTIDVDKLDYLIRDAYAAGYDAVAIDYRRLLSNMVICFHGNELKIGFKQNAISAIESVIVAHDFERKWIHSHPVCVYENFILQQAIEEVSKYFLEKSGKKLFSYDSLTEEGQKFNVPVIINGKQEIMEQNIALLCDDDIICYIKNKCSDALIKQLFARNKRMKSFWKSEAEYTTLFDAQGTGIRQNMSDIFLVLFTLLKSLVDKNQSAYDCQPNSDTAIINGDTVKKLNAKLEEAKVQLKTTPDIIMEIQVKEAQIEFVEQFINFLKTWIDSPEVIVIKANMFMSGFLKEDIGNILVQFKNKPDPVELNGSISILTAEKDKKSHVNTYFYIFYDKRKIKPEKGQNVTVDELVKFLKNAATTYFNRLNPLRTCVQQK